MAGTTTPLALLRIQRKSLTYIYFSLATFLTQALFCLYVVFALQGNAFQFTTAITAASMLSFVFGIIVLLKNCEFTFRFDLVKDSLKFSLPLLPAALIDGIFNTFDKFFLETRLSTSQLGTYTVGQQLASALNMFNFLFKSSWIPMTFQIAAEKKDSGQIIAKYSIIYMYLFCGIFVCSLILLKPLSLLLNIPNLTLALPYAPLLFVAVFSQAYATTFARGIELSGKTYLSVIPITISVVVLFLIINPLSSSFGLMGVAIAFSFSHVLRTTTQISLSHSVYKKPFYIYDNLLIVVVAALALTAYYNFEMIGDIICGLLLLAVLATALTKKFKYFRNSLPSDQIVSQ